MPETLQEKFIAALKLRLEAISISNGYQNDFQGVWHWRVTPFAEREFPALVIRDIGIEPDVATKMAGVQSNVLLMQVEIASLETVKIPKMVADVWQAIGIDREWGCMAFDTLPGSYRMVVEQDGNRVTGALVNFSIHYISQTFNAYE